MQKFRDLLFILILGSVSTALLLGVSKLTLPKIKNYEEITLKAAILEAANISYLPGKPEEVFKNKIKKQGNYYISPDGNYIFEFSGNGMWGPIKGVLNLNSDLKTIEKVKIISQEETPGLGSRITEKDFLNQFIKKRFSLLVAARNKAVTENEIDAITGATITSQSLLEILNASVLNFRKTM